MTLLSSTERLLSNTAIDPSKAVLAAGLDPQIAGTLTSVDPSNFSQQSLWASSIPPSRPFPYPGNNFNEAYNLGVVNQQTQRQEEIGGAIGLSPGVDVLDFFRFELPIYDDISITLTGLITDADLYLIKDFNNNNAIDAGEVVAASVKPGAVSESLQLSRLLAGTYYIAISSEAARPNPALPPQAAYTPYTLTVTRPASEFGATYSTAGELGVLTGQQVWNGSVSSSTDLGDLYRFYLDTPGNLQLNLSGLSGDANLYLVQDLNGNGIVDSADVIQKSTAIGSASETIARNNVPVGTYFAYVEAPNSNTNYTLTFTADASGDNYSSAQNLGVLNDGSRRISDFVSSTDLSDYFQFQIGATSNLTIALTELAADANLYLAQDLNGNGRFDAGEVLRSSTATGNTPETINAAGLAAGTYYVLVSRTSGATNYTLNITADAIAIQTLTGTLGADVFTPSSNTARTVISGNGNVNFGSGGHDRLNLSNLRSNSVTLNLAASNGGIAYNPGNGTRLFDRILLPNGRDILFEGIEVIQFADRAIPLYRNPPDPDFSQQWNLQVTGVHTAWQFTTGSNGVMIGIQDTGLGINSVGNYHPDLRSNTLFYNASNAPDEFLQDSGHGTAVQSIIAAQSNNGLGISGINWSSTMYNIDVLGRDLGDLSLAQATQAMIQAANSRGQRLIINLSLGSNSPGSPDFDRLVAQNPNVLFVVASGNDNKGSPDYPASLAQRFNNVIAVGGTDRSGNRVSYTDTSGSNYGSGLTLVAPGSAFTAQATPFRGSVNFGYSSFNGTSAAAPVVAGIASLVWSVKPTLSASQIKQILQQTAFDLGASGYDPLYGYGLVNADAAVRRAIALA